MKPASRTAEQLKERLVQLLASGIGDQVFPGSAVAVGWGGERPERVVCCQGHTGYAAGMAAIDGQTLFDLASLTKPLATNLAVLCLIKQGKLELDSTLLDLLPGVKLPGDKAGITLAQLLGHRSGLPAHREYFSELIKLEATERRQALLALLLREELIEQPGRRAIYSDLGYMLLGEIVERAAGCRLDRLAAEAIYRPLGLEQELFFRPLADAASPASFAATEECPWRSRLLIGEVHDDNCWAVGGVCGQAGLFGTINAVFALCRLLLDQYHDRASHPRYDNKDLRTLITSRQPDSCWALGFDTPSPRGSSSGRYFSSASFGHLGFTGTSCWIDPRKEVVVVLLTNRVHPDRKNERIKEFRPRLHDAVMECLGLA